MLIRLFRSNQTLALFTLPLFAIALWIVVFLWDITEEPGTIVMPVFYWIRQLVSEPPLIGEIITLLLIVAEAIILKWVVERYKLLDKRGNLVAMLYILALSCVPGMLQLNEVVFANLFLLLALNKILAFAGAAKATSLVFDAACYIGLASLLFFPAIIWLLVCGIGMAWFIPFNWREWLIAVIGVALPYLFLWVFFFWQGMPAFGFDQQLWRHTWSVALDFNADWSLYALAGTGMLIVMLALPAYFRQMASSTVRIRKMLVLMVWAFIVSLAALYASSGFNISHLALIAIPAAVYAGNYFNRLKRIWIGDLLLLILLTAIVYNHYIQLI